MALLGTNARALVYEASKQVSARVGFYCRPRVAIGPAILQVRVVNFFLKVVSGRIAAVGKLARLDTQQGWPLAEVGPAHGCQQGGISVAV